MWNAGLVPFGENEAGAEDLRYGHRSALVDHAEVHGCENLITLIGLRLTTARLEAERAIDLVFRKRGQRPPAGRTSTTPVHGGRIPGWDELVAEVTRETAPSISREVAHSLASHYGTEYRAVLGQRGHNALRVIAGSTIRAQVYHAVRVEKARTLGDIVLRRTDLGTGAYPGRAALTECAQIAADELGWTPAEAERQVGVLAEVFPPWERQRKDTPGPTFGSAAAGAAAVAR
jgi:glycerol-3-phosphate dehydrogenase